MLFVFDLDKVYLADILYNHCIVLLSKLVQKFCMKFEYVFSDPECPLMFCVCEILKAIRIILRGRQGTVDSFNCYSRRSVFSLIVVILNFRNYLRSVLFPKIVVSALTGLVLYLCHDFSCLTTGSRF